MLDGQRWTRTKGGLRSADLERRFRLLTNRLERNRGHGKAHPRPYIQDQQRPADCFRCRLLWEIARTVKMMEVRR